MTLVVWRLDRLGRALHDLIGWMTWLEEQKVGLLSLQESIDVNTTSGKFTFHLFGASAEFERNLIHERIQDGLTAARVRGRKGGRPKVLDNDKRDWRCGFTRKRKHRLLGFARCSAIRNRRSMHVSALKKPLADEAESWIGTTATLCDRARWIHKPESYSSIMQ